MCLQGLEGNSLTSNCQRILWGNVYLFGVGNVCVCNSMYRWPIWVYLSVWRSFHVLYLSTCLPNLRPIFAILPTNYKGPSLRGHPVGHSLRHPRFGDTLGDTPRDTQAQESPVAGRRGRKPIYLVRSFVVLFGFPLFFGDFGCFGVLGRKFTICPSGPSKLLATLPKRTSAFWAQSVTLAGSP